MQPKEMAACENGEIEESRVMLLARASPRSRQQGSQRAWLLGKRLEAL